MIEIILVIEILKDMAHWSKIFRGCEKLNGSNQS